MADRVVRSDTHGDHRPTSDDPTFCHTAYIGMVQLSKQQGIDETSHTSVGPQAPPPVHDKGVLHSDD